MGLRLTDGIPRGRFEALAGRQPEASFDPAVLERLAQGGFIEVDEHGIRATPEGRQRLDAVLGALIAGPAVASPSPSSLPHAEGALYAPSP